jgi:hypothetical protein
MVHLVMVLAGLFGVAAAAPSVARLVTTIRSAGSTPVPARVAVAADGRLVTLTDARLQCETRTVYRDSMTFFHASDPAGGVPFIAQVLGAVTCEAASTALTGAFVKDPPTPAELRRWGVEVRDGSAIRFFTPLAMPKYLWPALLLYVAILLVGGMLAAIGIRGLVRAMRAANPPGVR